MDAIMVQSNVGDSKRQITDLPVQPLDENSKMDTTNSKKKKRRKRKKAIVEDEGQSLDQNNIDTRLTNNTAKGNPIMENLKIKDEVQSVDQTKMGTWPIENLAEGNVTGKRTKKRKGIAKAEIEDEVQSEMIARSLAEGNLTTKKSKIKDEVQNIGPTKMDIRSTENSAEGNVNIESPKIQDETQIMYQTNLDSGQAQSFIKGIVAGKSKKKKKRKKAAIVVDDVQKGMDARSTENLDEGSVTINKPKVKHVSLGKTQMNTGSTENLADGKVIIENPKTEDEAQSMDKNRIDTWRLAENLTQGNVTGKRRKKQKKKRGKVNDEVHSERDTTRSKKNLAEANATLNKPETKDAVQSVALARMDTGSTENVRIEKPKVQDEIQSIDQAKMDTVPAQKFAEENVSVKRKKKPRKKKAAKVKDEFSGRMDAGSTENPIKGSVSFENQKNKDEGQSMDKVKMDTGTAKDFSKEHVTGKRKKKRGNTRKEKIVGEFLSRSRDGTMPSLHLSEGHPNLLVGEKVISLNGLSTEIMLDEGIGHAEGRSAPSTCNAFTVKDAEVLCHRMAPFASVRRKLLVLDINGLLADIVFPAPKHCEGDIKVYGRAVFRRPFCDDFLKFCFQNFYVGIWSSRTKRIIDKVVSYLLGDQKDKLLFCWDMTHSTQTGFKTLENRHKPLVCKELRKIWEHDDPSWPWKKGDYNESNTLLLDDSPYKALLNPLHTAIFPHPYQYSDKNDNLLGPGGDLRVYLEGLVTSENVQKYVERHPFGQRPISEQNLSWEFYNQVINQMSNVEPRT